jgi:hypothetical protein
VEWVLPEQLPEYGGWAPPDPEGPTVETPEEPALPPQLPNVQPEFIF